MYLSQILLSDNQDSIYLIRGLCLISFGYVRGVKTFRTKYTSDLRHFGSAELSGPIGTSAEVSYGYFGTKEDTLALGNTGPIHG